MLENLRGYPAYIDWYGDVPLFWVPFLGCFRTFWAPFRLFPDFWVSIFLVQFDFFKNNPHFWVLILIFYIKWHCGMLPARLWFLLFFSKILSILVKQNGNNKRIERFSNDSTVFISVLSCSCKEFHIVYNWYQFE